MLDLVPPPAHLDPRPPLHWGGEFLSFGPPAVPRRLRFKQKWLLWGSLTHLSRPAVGDRLPCIQQGSIQYSQLTPGQEPSMEDIQGKETVSQLATAGSLWAPCFAGLCLKRWVQRNPQQPGIPPQSSLFSYL